MKTNRQESNPTIVVLNPRLLNMLKINLKTLLLIIFTSILFLFLPLPIHAQTISLSVWPPILEAVLKPNQSYTQIYQLKNQGDDITVQTALIPFESADEFGHITLQTKAFQSPALNYFTLNNSPLPQSFTLKAGETKNINLTINIPQTALNSDHYLTLLFQSETKGLITGTGSKTLPAVGSNILLTIPQPNQPKPTVKIQAFSISQPILDSFDSINFNLLVKNTSNHFLKTQGHIDIFNSFNKKVATIPLRSDNILKQSIRQLISDNPWNPLFPLGRYKAIVSLTPVNSTNNITQTITFYAFPYKALAVFLLLFLLFKKQKSQ